MILNFTEMKRIVLFMAAVAALFCSCQKEIEKNQLGGGKLLIFS